MQKRIVKQISKKIYLYGFKQLRTALRRFGILPTLHTSFNYDVNDVINIEGLSGPYTYLNGQHTIKSKDGNTFTFSA